MPLKNVWFRDETERQEHIDMIRAHVKIGGKIHMKHPGRFTGNRATDDKPAFGVVTDGEPTVFFDDGTSESFYSIEEMVDSGWVVD